MFIYLINIENTDLYKIGVSKNPEKRLKSLQTANGKKLSLINSFETQFNYKLETFLHQYFSLKKKLGEWFILEPTDVDNFISYCEKGESIFKLLKKNNTYLDDKGYFKK